MGKRDPRVDAYIAKAQPFARPILAHIRALVHAACPKAEETLKWGAPTFMYADEMLCSIASFKEHATFGFWKGALIVDAKGKQVEAAMGQFGRLTTVSDLPARRVLAGYVKKAMKLNDDKIKVAKTKPGKAKPAVVPADLKAALAKNKKAAATFGAFPPSCRRDYIEWITEAKQDATRQRRLETTIEWLAAGKKRNWKYMNC